MQTSYDSYKSLQVIRLGGVVTVTLNRPDFLNAINEAMHEELARIFVDIGSDEEARVVVLTGAGEKAFCSGGDIVWMNKLLDPREFTRTTIEGRRIIYSMLDCQKPIIARLNGHAIGLGATIALFSDIVVAVDTAKIADPHVRVGLTAGDGGAVIWPQLVGFARAKEYLLTGNALGAGEAERIGLINYAVPASELDARVAGFVKQIDEGATVAIAGTKVSVNVALKQLAHAILETSFTCEALSNLTSDHREAVAAFGEKRPAKFTGR